MLLSGKKVLLGVTGGIAAYKTTYLVRLLIKAGAEVKVILTPEARDFVTPLTLSTLSKNPVYWSFFDEDDDSGTWHNHVELGLWADYFIIAPCTANTLSKMTSGASDHFLLATYLSAKCPVFFAPAMDLDMYKHPSTKANIDKLTTYGNIFIKPGTGELASGLSGEGRMAEPEEIIETLIDYIQSKLPLKGKRILVNAGPTYEAIDPVRFIGNYSSGKMGVSIAIAAMKLGATVDLVVGPGVQVPTGLTNVTRITSARELLDVCSSKFTSVDIAILSAAVSDYRPENTADRKLKKDGGAMHLTLVENPDVLATLGKTKNENQILVGFALETNDPLENARKKLHKKNCDFIVLNQPTANTGFAHDTNEVTLVSNIDEPKVLGLKKKEEIAYEILEYISTKFINQHLK